MGRVMRTLASSYSVRNNAVLEMSDECFKNIINGSTGGLTTKLYHLRAATRSEKAKNWSSVVKDLVLAWNENLPSDIKRYEFLRHA